MSGSAIEKQSLGDSKLELQKFKSKEDIKPWLLDYLLKTRGIHIAIARSDSKKMIFRCKPKKNTTGAKARSCPFKIRANYSIKKKNWNLVVINDNHDHEIEGLSRGQIAENYDDIFKNKRPFVKYFPESSATLDMGEESTARYNSSNLFDSSLPAKAQITVQAHKYSNHSDASNESISGKQMNNPLGDFAGFTKKRRIDNLKQGTDTKQSQLNLKNDASTNEMFRHDVNLDFLYNEVTSLINSTLFNNHGLLESDKKSMVKLFFSKFVDDYRAILISLLDLEKNRQNVSLDVTHTHSQGFGSSANMNTSSSGTNSNLIPLSPLLNESNDEYLGQNSSSPLNGQSVDTFSQMSHPGMVLPLHGLVASHIAGLVPNNANLSMLVHPTIPPISMSVAQQLPSFNTIQNQITVSPKIQSVTSSSFMSLNLPGGTSSFLQSAALAPLSSNNTMNPSHIQKSVSSRLLNTSNGNTSSQNTSGTPSVQSHSAVSNDFRYSSSQNVSAVTSLANLTQNGSFSNVSHSVQTNANNPSPRNGGGHINSHGNSFNTTLSSILGSDVAGSSYSAAIHNGAEQHQIACELGEHSSSKVNAGSKESLLHSNIYSNSSNIDSISDHW